MWFLGERVIYYKKVSYSCGKCGERASAETSSSSLNGLLTDWTRVAMLYISSSLSKSEWRSGCSQSSFVGFKQNTKRTMRDRGRESGRRDIYCWPIVIGSVEIEGSTDCNKDTEFSAGIRFPNFSERLHWHLQKQSDRYSYCRWIMTKRFAYCDKSNKFNRKLQICVHDRPQNPKSTLNSTCLPAYAIHVGTNAFFIWGSRPHGRLKDVLK